MAVGLLMLAGEIYLLGLWQESDGTGGASIVSHSTSNTDD